MSSEESRKRKIRIGLIVITVILVLLGIIQLIFTFYLDSYVEKRITSAISEQTKGQYELKMDDLDLNVWGRSLEMVNIRLHPSDSSSTAPKVDLDNFSINHIRFFPFLFGGNIHVGQVRLASPKLTVVHNSPDSLRFLQSSDSSSTQKKKRAIQADQFLIENGHVDYWNEDQSKSRGELNDFNLDISEIRVDSTTQSKPLFADFDAIQTSSGKIRYELNNDLYAIETNGFNISSANAMASVDSLKLIPLLPKYEFSQKIGHQHDRITLTVAGLKLENPDFEKLKSGEFKAERFIIDQADLEVFHSKKLPPGPVSEKTFPQVAFKNLKVPVSVDTITIHHSEIRYTEHLPDITDPGTVTFADVNATISSVTNDSTIISQGHDIVLDVTSEVMNAALLDAHFVFPMHKNGAHSVRGTLGSIQAEKLNPILEPVGMVRAADGTLHSLQFMMDLGEEEATGWVLLVYSNLKVEILDAENVNEGGKQRFKTFLANALKVKKNNNKEPFRRGEVSMERIHTKSIFSYWWKSLGTGLKDSIGM